MIPVRFFLMIYSLYHHGSSLIISDIEPAIAENQKPGYVLYGFEEIAQWHAESNSSISVTTSDEDEGQGSTICGFSSDLNNHPSLKASAHQPTHLIKRN